VLDSLKM